MIKAVVIDLDGTLLNSKKKISQRNIAALQAVKNEGVNLIFATARPPRAVYFDNIDLSQLGNMVYYNGALFQCKMTNQTFHHSIIREMAANVMDYCLSLCEGANLCIEVKDHWFSYKALEYTRKSDFKDEPEILPLQELKSFDCTKILLTDFHFFDQLMAKFGDELNILVTDEGTLVQIMSNKASKENAIKNLCYYMDISMEQVICFGDDFNDLGLFRECGTSVAMGNAVSALKEIASETTDTNDNDGVAIILEKLVKDLRMQEP